MTSPLSQTTGNVQQIIAQAESSLQHASTLKDQMYENQQGMISTWQGNASTKYIANAETLHDDLTTAIQRLQTVMNQGDANVKNVASADNG
jgi:uncharacterized protein YukE